MMEPLRFESHGETYCMEILPEKNARGGDIICHNRIPLNEKICASCKARKEKEVKP